MANQHFDVVIVGAGLSGIGAAYHLQKNCPQKTYAIVEGRANIGGTWDLFKYPGVRSDSDMHTLGYKFKPWLHKKAIADGPSILSYIRETAQENNIIEHIVFNAHVNKITWSSTAHMWTIEANTSQDGDVSTFTCSVISMCCGYYRYDKGFTPNFENINEFTGQVVHPQIWPESLDCANKKIVIIGSGATAMTLGPVLAKEAAHVTMLQRSPTYVVSMPSEDIVAKLLNKLLPKKAAYCLVRWKNISFGQFGYWLARAQPRLVKKILVNRLSKQLGKEFVAEHFTPSYMPWDQRICVVPDDDLFKAIKQGKLSVVTNTIRHFSSKGIVLENGQSLDADIVVTATGLNLLRLGGIEIVVNDKTVDISNSLTYKGIMYSGIPNLFNTFGYINASWTLRADLISQFVCKLINHMDNTNSTKMEPTIELADMNIPKYDMIKNFSANYMKRAIHEFGKQGNKNPWLNHQHYKLDKKAFNEGTIEDGVLIFSGNKVNGEKK